MILIFLVICQYVIVLFLIWSRDLISLVIRPFSIVSSHLAIHQIVNESLAAIQISPQVVTDLDQSITFLLQARYRVVFMRELCLELSDLGFADLV